MANKDINWFNAEHAKIMEAMITEATRQEQAGTSVNLLSAAYMHQARLDFAAGMEHFYAVLNWH